MRISTAILTAALVAASGIGCFALMDLEPLVFVDGGSDATPARDRNDLSGESETIAIWTAADRTARSIVVDGAYLYVALFENPSLNAGRIVRFAKCAGESPLVLTGTLYGAVRLVTADRWVYWAGAFGVFRVAK